MDNEILALDQELLDQPPDRKYSLALIRFLFPLTLNLAMEQIKEKNSSSGYARLNSSPATIAAK
jgi:hypothetical protein